MGRRLASKKLRAALYIAADGRCLSCGERLGAGWHADHIVPWVVSKRTNVHEMRALCPRCNLKKGKRMEITNRSFQVELMSRAHEVAENGEKLTTAHITPGGGKTRGGSLFGSILFNKGKVNQVVWVCPRQSLCDQVAEGFAKVETLGERRRALRVASNDPPLSRDKEVTAGYTTTIQAITANLDLHRHHFERHRVLLIVDEFHHYPATGGDDESAAWSRAIKALAEMSTYVLAMTGTLQRNKDNRGIIWVEYDDERKAQPCHITYGRRKAIEEGSKLRFVPKYWDGPAEFDIRGVGLETRIEDPAQEVKRTITWSLA